MRTYTAKPGSVAQQWLLVDAKGATLGRLATEIAHRLRGKDKPEFTPHEDVGDYVVVVNASEVEVTGRKETDKMYYHHTGYVGHLKEINFEKLRAKDPERLLRLAVKGMMPRGPLGRQMLKKLKIYGGAEHKHHAQKLQPLNSRKGGYQNDSE